MAYSDDRSHQQAQAENLLSRLQDVRSRIEELASQAAGTKIAANLSLSLSEIAGAEAALAQAARSGGAMSAADLSAITRLIQNAEATTSAAAIAVAAQTAAAAGNLTAASAATRQNVESLSNDLFQRRIFDPYLGFASAEEEADYRAREAERQRAIAEQLALHTPEGDLMAGGLTAGQMLDANAHGAGASPEFQPRWDHLVAALRQQRQAMLEAGRSTAAFDRQITTEIRQFLKAKGLSEAEITARLAAAASPLDAAEPYLADHGQASGVPVQFVAPGQPVRPGTHAIRIEQTEIGAPVAAPPAEVDFAAMAAKLRAAGVQMEASPAPSSGHGLAVAEPVPAPGLALKL